MSNDQDSTGDRFSERQRRAFEALERTEAEEAAASTPLPVEPKKPAPRPAVRPAPTGRKPESPVGILIVSFVALVVATPTLLLVSDEWVSVIAIVIALAASVATTAAVIAIGVRWGMGLHSWDRDNR